MLNWSLVKTALVLAALTVLPVMVLLVLGAWSNPSGASFEYWNVGFGVMFAAGLCSLAVAYLWHQRLARQVDKLIEHCHTLALGEEATRDDWPQSLAEFGRLGLAIDVLREALVDYLSLYRRFFEAAPDMFLSLSPAGGRILDANHIFCTTVGMLRSELLGQPVDKFVRLDEGWDMAVNGQGGLQKGQIVTNQGIVQIEASISLEKGPEGQPWVLGAILRDVTQRESLHRELLTKSTALERALEEIKNVEELKDQFLTTLSHELKTPLVSLKGFLQLIISGRMKPGDQENYLEICWRNLSKLETQINNLLDLARLAHAKDQYEMEPLEFCNLIRTEVENLRPLASERDVHLDLSQVEQGPLMVRGNAEKLIQLVDNLLINAVKYNKEGGGVMVSLRRHDLQVELKVTDSGVGIAREHMAKIFNRFYRADLSGTGRLEGLGIGLSLVQEIVQLHQGDIRVESEPGVGTSFTVLLEARS
jgi:two-component system phosphate regulon sensor histidine kinase PhoR